MTGSPMAETVTGTTNDIIREISEAWTNALLESRSRNPHEFQRLFLEKAALAVDDLFERRHTQAFAQGAEAGRAQAIEAMMAQRPDDGAVWQFKRNAAKAIRALPPAGKPGGE